MSKLCAYFGFEKKLRSEIRKKNQHTIIDSKSYGVDKSLYSYHSTFLNCPKSPIFIL